MNYAYQNQSSASSAQSDRLRKAIERNRAKQARRSGRAETVELSKASSGFRAQTKDSWEMVQASSPSRTSISRGGSETQFTTPIRQRANTPPATASYLTRSPARTSTPTQSVRRTTSVTRARVTPIKKAKVAGKRTIQDYLTMAGWGFCCFLLLRLIFSDRGVIDYYKKKDFLADKIFRTQMIDQDNLMLMKEIERLDRDRAYQKKIVRDHLGFIADDEYLILFAQEKKITSI